MKSLIVIIIIFTFRISYPQLNAGAKEVSISNSGTALCDNAFALFYNPAGLAQMNWREIGIYYSPAPFGFKEMANGCIAFNEPFSFGSIALGGMSYGFELYKETKVLLGYSHNFINKFFLGAALTYHSVSIKKYGSKSVLYFNFGGLAYITEDIRWGFFIYNINRTSFTQEDDQIPTVFNSGFSYNLIPEVSLNLAYEKDIRYTGSLRMGIDYSIIKYLSIRTGFSTEPSTYSAGIGINYSFINLDYALFNHPDLGLTHQAGIIISFGNAGNRDEKIREFLNLK